MSVSQSSKAEGSKDRSAWQGRPKAAFAVSALAVLTPIALGFAAGFATGFAIPTASGALERIGRFIAIGLVSCAVALLAERQTRRLAPITAMLKMSLVFPDNAPSRFSIALRAGVLSKMESRLVDGHTSSSPDGATMTAVAAEMVALVSALRTHDARTRGHSERVRAYADLLGEEMGLSADERQKLQWGALLHDVGKMSVPAAILNKPGKPDAAEWAVLQNHPAASKARLEPLSGWLGQWAAAAWEHHERWDGTGYPNGLSGKDITLSGRIVAVADAFEVMTAVRSYKKAMPAAQARAELARCAGSHFDPTVVRAMMAVSVKRLSAVNGGLAWISQLPFFGWTASPGGLTAVAFSAGRTAIFAGAVGVGAVGTVTAATGGVKSASSPLATERVVVASSRFGSSPTPASHSATPPSISTSPTSPPPTPEQSTPVGAAAPTQAVSDTPTSIPASNGTYTSTVPASGGQSLNAVTAGNTAPATLPPTTATPTPSTSLPQTSTTALPLSSPTTTPQGPATTVAPTIPSSPTTTVPPSQTTTTTSSGGGGGSTVSGVVQSTLQATKGTVSGVGSVLFGVIGGLVKK